MKYNNEYIISQTQRYLMAFLRTPFQRTVYAGPARLAATGVGVAYRHTHTLVLARLGGTVWNTKIKHVGHQPIRIWKTHMVAGGLLRTTIKIVRDVYISYLQRGCLIQLSKKSSLCLLRSFRYCIWYQIICTLQVWLTIIGFS